MAEEKRRSPDCRSLGGDNHIFFTVYFIHHLGWWRVTSILCTRPFPRWSGRSGESGEAALREVRAMTAQSNNSATRARWWCFSGGVVV